MNDQFFMRRCLQLAEAGRSYVAPNPMVGSVIVHEGKIIGEGYHTAFGKPHAEPEAIDSVEDRTLLRSSTLYVNLEPCAHHGKTPPCAERIVREGIPRVVIGSSDPNPLVAGKGISILKNAGIEVISGVLENECRNFNIRFYTFHELKRPYVVLKWAQSKDGFIGKRNVEERVKISNEATNQLVHKWRSEEQAILVGKNTALADDPGLDVRNWKGRDPVRIILDERLELPPTLKIFSKDRPTIILNTVRSDIQEKTQWVKLPEMSADEILKALYACNINSVLVEGGAKVIETFINAGSWDEARVITSQKELGEGVIAPEMKSEVYKAEQLGSDSISCYRNSSYSIRS
jgi:diaminohydroxyphosphoribosylaminopyrimidine deaminase/5-amino-6-(5-phosphoribosylamino)uracil reductase